jgi:hypothetical protein
MKSIFLRLALLLMIFPGCLISGCGYQFRAGGEPVGISLQSLAIPLFTSTSSEIGLEADFTKVIRNEFISHARVPLVPEERAQMVIVGRIYEVSTLPLAYESRQQSVSGQVATYEVTSSRTLRIFLDVQLLDKVSGKAVWRERNMTEKTIFIVDTDPFVTRFNQEQAVEEVARRLAKRIYLKTMERF